MPHNCGLFEESRIGEIMNLRIHKYSLEVVGEQMVEMPEGATVLTVQAQKGVPCIWAEVDVTQSPIKRCFFTYGTGEQTGKAKHYVGTYQLNDGDWVYHVYTDRVEYPRDA